MQLHREIRSAVHEGHPEGVTRPRPRHGSRASPSGRRRPCFPSRRRRTRVELDTPRARSRVRQLLSEGRRSRQYESGSRAPWADTLERKVDSCGPNAGCSSPSSSVEAHRPGLKHLATLKYAPKRTTHTQTSAIRRRMYCSPRPVHSPATGAVTGGRNSASSDDQVRGRPRMVAKHQKTALARKNCLRSSGDISAGSDKTVATTVRYRRRNVTLAPGH